MGSSKACKSEIENLVQTDEECLTKEGGGGVFLLLKMFQAEKSPEHQEMLWCCGKTLWQEEERIRGDGNGQDLESSSDWSKVNGAGQGRVSFPGGRGNLPYNNTELEDLQMHFM